MSETHTVKGVKITVLGGGFYSLEHASLAEMEKVRGKEVADARAEEIAAAADAGGAMDAQGDLSTMTIPEVQKSDDEKAPTKTDGKSDELAELKAKLAAAEERNAEFEEAAKMARTVLQDGEIEDTSFQQGIAPKEYTGEMDSKTKKALAKAGITVTKIILEESESIPPTGLFISHNYRPYMISPGEPVDVPDFLLGVLDDAVTANPVTDPKTQKVLGYRSRSKYPYRRV